jgi:DNA-binding transcriptional MerR regulator
MDKTETGRTYTRKELADKYGIGIETLRYYENIGLLEELERDGNNYRRYSEDYEKVLAFITNAKKRGFTLAEMKEFIAALNSPSASPERLLAAIDGKIETLSAQVASIQGQIAMLDELRRSERPGECETIASLKKKA